MMHTTDRLNAYYAQTGSQKLTPKQDRRWYAKLRRFERITQCPTCWESGHNACRTKTGNVAKASHANRPVVALK